MKSTKTVKKAKKMDFRVENIEGVDCLLFENNGNYHQIDLRAISSWGLLLGLTDTAEIVSAILRFKETPVAPGEPNLWTPLYEALGEGLEQMSQSGVPPEYVEDVLYSDAPVPTPEVSQKIIAAQSAGVSAINACPDEIGDVSSLITAALVDHETKIKDARVKFVDKLAPVYEIELTSGQ